MTYKHCHIRRSYFLEARKGNQHRYYCGNTAATPSANVGFPLKTTTHWTNIQRVILITYSSYAALGAGHDSFPKRANQRHGHLDIKFLEMAFLYMRHRMGARIFGAINLL